MHLNMNVICNKLKQIARNMQKISIKKAMKNKSHGN